MKFIRIGNDIPFKWTVLRGGKAERINPVTAEVQLYDKHNARCEVEYTIADNVITGVYRGMHQHRKGEYCLVLVENKDDVNMSTVDCAGCWVLVDHTRMQKGRDCCNIITNPVEIESDMDIPANGLSAYDIACLHGFEGTEEEWLKSLVAKSLMRLEQDAVMPETWNLLDWEDKAHGSFMFPHVVSAVFDNETKQITVKYNNESGRKELNISLETLKATNVGEGLKLDDEGNICIRIDEKSHEALSVSMDGLMLDGSHFAASENELFTELWSNKLYPDY